MLLKKRLFDFVLLSSLTDNDLENLCFVGEINLNTCFATPLSLNSPGLSLLPCRSQAPLLMVILLFSYSKVITGNLRVSFDSSLLRLAFHILT